jgi:hypothetical protein
VQIVLPDLLSFGDLTPAPFIENSTISDNSATAILVARGCAIYSNGADIISSTINGNFAHFLSNNNCISDAQGGNRNRYGDLEITTSTISGN